MALQPSSVAQFHRILKNCTVRVDLFALSSIAACIDVLPLLLLNPSFGVSACPVGMSFFFTTDLVDGVPEVHVHVIHILRCANFLEFQRVRLLAKPQFTGSFCDFFCIPRIFFRKKKTKE